MVATWSNATQVRDFSIELGHLNMNAIAIPSSCRPLRGLWPSETDSSSLRWALLAAALMGVAALGLEGASHAIFRSPDFVPVPSSMFTAPQMPGQSSGWDAARASSPVDFRWMSTARSAVLGMLCMVSLIAVVRAYQPRAARQLVPTQENNADEAQQVEAAYVAKRQELRARLARAAQSGTKLPFLVEEFMTRRLFTVAPMTRIATVAEMMHRERVRHVLVCDGRRVLGVISDRDLQRPHAHTAEQCMTVPPITVTADTTLATAASLMLAKHINCLPVCEDGQALGIMTTVDLVVAMQCLIALVDDLMSQRARKVPAGSTPSDNGATGFAEDPAVP